MELKSQIEAIIFNAEEPVLLTDISAFFANQYGIEYHIDELQALVDESIAFYETHALPFAIIQSGGGYLFKSKPDYHSLISDYLQRDEVKKLTKVALETLAIVAYKQPVTKTDIEMIRGVNSDYTVQRLMERDLIEIKGRSEEVGKPLFYGTTNFFLDYFGINSLDELPKLKEFTDIENQIGEQQEIIQEE